MMVCDVNKGKFHEICPRTKGWRDLIILRAAQRLAAQPLGHFRVLVTILAGKYKSKINVFSLSLGQVGCSRVLGTEMIIASIKITRWR
jgi:hypothetical protein